MRQLSISKTSIRTLWHRTNIIPKTYLSGRCRAANTGWLDYVNHFSADWQEEYARYCEEKGLAVGNESAAEFVRFKDEQLEAAMESGDA